MSLLAPPIELQRTFPQVYLWLVPRLNFMLQQFPSAQPTSWFRSRARNFEVGGAAKSQHLLAFAADFTLPHDEHAELVRLAQGFGMQAFDEGSHVHVQIFPAGFLPEHLF